MTDGVSMEDVELPSTGLLQRVPCNEKAAPSCQDADGLL